MGGLLVHAFLHILSLEESRDCKVVFSFSEGKRKREILARRKRKRKLRPDRAQVSENNETGGDSGVSLSPDQPSAKPAKRNTGKFHSFISGRENIFFFA